MAITKSARKALRQNIRRRAKNLVYKTKIKNLIKEIRTLVTEKKIAAEGEPRPKWREEAKKILPQIYQILDKAAKTGVIKKNTADRKKSRLTKLVSKNTAK